MVLGSLRAPRKVIGNDLCCHECAGKLIGHLWACGAGPGLRADRPGWVRARIAGLAPEGMRLRQNAAYLCFRASLRVGPTSCVTARVRKDLERPLGMCRALQTQVHASSFTARTPRPGQPRATAGFVSLLPLPSLCWSVEKHAFLPQTSPPMEKQCSQAPRGPERAAGSEGPGDAPVTAPRRDKGGVMSPGRLPAAGVPVNGASPVFPVSL